MAWPSAACTTTLRVVFSATVPTAPGRCRTSRSCPNRTRRCIRTYLHAAMVFGIPKYGAVAQQTLGYVLDALVDPEGGIRGSQDADEGYYRRDAAGRAQMTAPRWIHEYTRRGGAHGLRAPARQRHAHRRSAPRRLPRRRAAAPSTACLPKHRTTMAACSMLIAPDGRAGRERARSAIKYGYHTPRWMPSRIRATRGIANRRRRIAAWMLRTLLAPTGFRDRPLERSGAGAPRGTALGIWRRTAPPPNSSCVSDWLTGEETYQEIADARSRRVRGGISRRRAPSRQGTRSPGCERTANRAMS